jgi:hypothetical protein
MTSPFRPVLLLIAMVAVMITNLSPASGQSSSQVVQQAAPCVFDVRPGNLTISPAGGSIATSVSAQDGCPWSASVNVTWITVMSGARGNGDGAAMFSVAANTGPLRSANITIAGQTFPVTQDASGSVSK